MVEDNGTRESGPNLGRKMELEKKSEKLEKIIVSKENNKFANPLPFPTTLQKQKVGDKTSKILEVLKQVKINIPLLDMIKQVPNYVNFLKDLCTTKRKIKLSKRAYLIEQVCVIIENKASMKYKNLGCPTISMQIGDTYVEKALLDLRASVNLLPYSI